MIKQPGKDILLVCVFYMLSSLVYYTASWISWGGIEKGYQNYFKSEEYFASGGAQFIISFIITASIWFFTDLIKRRYSLKLSLLSHLVFLPLYIFACYFLLLATTKVFGWAMYWGGYKVVWTLYNFMLFYVLQFGLIYAYGYWKTTIRDQKEKAMLRQLALQSEITALKAQLNPHFLHNLFNSIVASIPSENESTRELIIKLSDLFRYQNYVSNQNEVAIFEEIEFIKNYLELMKVRLKDRLTYSIDIEETIENTLIAPMLIHPLIENSIIHGVAEKIDPSKITIKIFSCSNKVHVSIIDTGKGLPVEEWVTGSGKGLYNTRLRLEKIYGSTLNIESSVETGTKISFAI